MPLTLTSYPIATNKDHTSDPSTVLAESQPSKLIDYWLTSRENSGIQMLICQVLPYRIEDSSLTLSRIGCRTAFKIMLVTAFSTGASKRAGKDISSAESVDHLSLALDASIYNCCQRALIKACRRSSCIAIFTT